MTDNRASEGTGQAEALDGIPGRSVSMAAVTPQATETIPDEIPKEPTKEEKKAQKKSVRDEKRSQRPGVSFAWALILLILTNIAWMGYIQFVSTPRWESVVSGYRIALEQKDEEIRRIQVIYREREKDFEKRLTEAEEKYAELNERLERAIEKYNKYFGKDDQVE
ncbi:MAG: hypothetical protein J5822_04320 [Eubacteriaceae bacterium]|nr:hypothetical protein [Eubacteriaceae bacterium]